MPPAQIAFLGSVSRAWDAPPYEGIQGREEGQFSEVGEVIWDNLKPHKDAEAVAAVKRRGAKVVRAPPWSPDLMPVEKL